MFRNVPNVFLEHPLRNPSIFQPFMHQQLRGFLFALDERSNERSRRSTRQGKRTIPFPSGVQSMPAKPDASPPAVSPETVPSLINATQLALMLGVSETYAKEMDRSGRIPGGVNIGSYRRWSCQVVSDWIRQGCPEQ
jgi:hypothetical protein